jgi:hypothetical protein
MVSLPITGVEFFVDATLGHRRHSFAFADSFGLDVLCHYLWWSSCVRFWLCLFDSLPVGAQAHKRKIKSLKTQCVQYTDRNASASIL